MCHLTALGRGEMIWWVVASIDNWLCFTVMALVYFPFLSMQGVCEYLIQWKSVIYPLMT